MINEIRDLLSWLTDEIRDFYQGPIDEFHDIFPNSDTTKCTQNSENKKDIICINYNQNCVVLKYYCCFIFLHNKINKTLHTDNFKLFDHLSHYLQTLIILNK